MANNPFLYTVIMTLQHVALPSFLIIFSVSGLVNVPFYTSSCLFTFVFSESRSVGSVKSRLQSVKSQY